MNKLLVASSVLLMITGFAAAQNVGEVRPEPGLVDASSPIYGLDVAVDNAAVDLGLRSPGDVAFERASEVSRAQERNQTTAQERASERLNEIAERASSNDTEGLQKAISVLQQVRERTPDQANVGLDTAIGNLERAQERSPDDVGPASGAGNGGRP